MTDPIGRCPDHGYHEGRCPECGERGEDVLSGDRRRRLSKFCSGALRHFPDDAGIELDDAGWADWDRFVEAVDSKYDWATPDHVAGVVATDPKGRFERTTGEDEAGDRVRAAYGHSVDVDLNVDDTPVPATLFHGTAPRNVDSIREDGLKPMNRQQVHLSDSVAAARTVGERHAADPVVFAVDAAAMRRDGFRVVQRGRDTYTTDRVPPRYLDRVD